MHMRVFMKSTQDVPSDQRYFLMAIAPSGLSIEPCVFLVAQGIASQAVSYAEKFLGDSCVAVNLLEEAADGLNSQILLDQLLGHFDSVTREMILRRIEGHSWGEIASEFELSNHAARVRFSKALQWLRTSVETPWNRSLESTLPRSKKCHRPRDTKAQRVAAFERRLERMFTPAFYREFHRLLRVPKTTGL